MHRLREGGLREGGKGRGEERRVLMEGGGEGGRREGKSLELNVEGGEGQGRGERGRGDVCRVEDPLLRYATITIIAGAEFEVDGDVADREVLERR